MKSLSHTMIITVVNQIKNCQCFAVIGHTCCPITIVKKMCLFLLWRKSLNNEHIQTTTTTSEHITHNHYNHHLSSDLGGTYSIQLYLHIFALPSCLTIRNIGPNISNSCRIWIFQSGRKTSNRWQIHIKTSFVVTTTKLESGADLTWIPHPFKRSICRLILQRQI